MGDTRILDYSSCIAGLRLLAVHVVGYRYVERFLCAIVNIRVTR